MENLLEWARIQTGKIKYQPVLLELKSIIEDTLSIFDQSIKNKNLTIIDEVIAGTKIYCDKSITETILRNLISNAVKFTNKSGSITISSDQNDESVLIKIKDSGVGMDEKKLRDIFRIDVNTSTKGTAMESGTGLGLIISKEFVEKQGGKIWVESRKNEGTTFYFTVKQSE
jgi:signal transduction histidine kinase